MPTSKTKKDKKAKKALDALLKSYADMLASIPKETAKERRVRLAQEAKEKRRRAKKITMTVGEYEDALEEARNQYDD